VAVDEAGDADRATTWLGGLYGIDPSRFERSLVCGPAADVADMIGAFVATGADHVALMIASSRPLEHLAALVPQLAARRAPA
ncbi:MAG TPA: hypothetical protein VGM93_03975, partial [Acidimicrobiales bacterium]